VPRILLVDDDIAEISAVKRVLARAGHQPALATNASDAQVAVEHERPDLLLVSATCEGGDALRLVHRLSEDPATVGIPLIVLGEAASLPEGARRLARPVDPEQLTAEVKAVLGNAEAVPVEAPPAPGARTTALGRLKSGKAPPPPAGLKDAAAARRAAADALRARAEELRRSAPRAPSNPATAAAAAPAAPPPAAPRPTRSPLAAPILLPPLPEKAPSPPPPAAPPAARAAASPLASELDLEDGELEAVLRRRGGAAGRPGDGALPPGDLEVAEEEDARHRAADEALRALEAEASARPDRQAEERALQEAIETARREAFETARRDLEERARTEAAEAARQLQAESRARREEMEELTRREAEEARRRGEAEAQARAEADARRHAEKELAALRAQREVELREADRQVAAVRERAAAEGQAAEELRHLAEEEVRRRDLAAQERGAEEERLRAAFESARAELDELRERNAAEVRRRSEAEEALRKLTEASRREAEERTAAQRQAEAASAAPSASPEGASYTPPPFFGPFEDGEVHAGGLEAAEGAARRRVAALRSAPDVPPAEPSGAAQPGRASAPGTAFPADGLDLLSSQAPPEALEEPARLVIQPPAQLRAGNLAELPAPRLLAQAARAKVFGRLDFEGEVARSFWLEDGQVVGASSADPAERLEEVALRLGLVTRDQHRQIAQASAALPARRAALLLLERGFLKPTELTGLVRRRTEEVVFGVFADPEATFRWVAAEVPPEERIALSRGALALAVEGVRRRWLAPRVDALLGGPGTLLVPVAGGPRPAELGLSPEERRAVGLADGLRTLDEISQASPLDPLSTRQVLAALVLCGVLTVRLLQAGRPAGQAAAAIDLARVKDKLDQVRRADYFTVLGVSRLCTPHEVRDAAERLRAEFEPRRFAGVPDDSLPARLAEILQVVEDASAVLADDRLRDEYLRGLG